MTVDHHPTFAAACIVLATIATVAVLPATPATAGPPTAEADLIFTRVNATTLRICGSGAVDDPTTLTGLWQFTVNVIRSDGSRVTVAETWPGASLAETCTTVGTASQTGAGGASVSFVGASTGGDITALCAAPLTHSPSSFPYPLTVICANPSEHVI